LRCFSEKHRKAINHGHDSPDKFDHGYLVFAFVGAVVSLSDSFRTKPFPSLIDQQNRH
jgi:hypothetical protein